MHILAFLNHENKLILTTSYIKIEIFGIHYTVDI